MSEFNAVAYFKNILDSARTQLSQLETSKANLESRDDQNLFVISIGSGTLTRIGKNIDIDRFPTNPQKFTPAFINDYFDQIDGRFTALDGSKMKAKVVPAMEFIDQQIQNKQTVIKETEMALESHG